MAGFVSVSEQLAVCAVVVTHNRPELLRASLAALDGQTLACTILVVDNGSSAATQEILHEWAMAAPVRHIVVRSEENRGGAGGFALGLAQALQCTTARWVWLMDDDAMVVENALQALIDVADDEDAAYGSTAVSGADSDQEQLAWPARTKGSAAGLVSEAGDLAPVSAVSTLPFLGFMVSRALVERIGPPDASYFLCADDVEYSARILRHGGSLYLVRASKIRHPAPQRWLLNLWGRQIDFRYLSIEKTYYEVRNKIRVAREYWPRELYLKTIPGLSLRLLLSLLLQPDRLARIRVYTLGFVDGLRGVGGPINARRRA